ncbi:hypothetical protein IT575_14240 [bacterium]|nr:hypothetical protein [bacterium]
MNQGNLSLLALLAEFPLFILRLFCNPRSLVRGIDWSHEGVLPRYSLLSLLALSLLVIGFSDFRSLAQEERPPLATFKAIVMRAHERSWDSAEALARIEDPAAREAAAAWSWLQLKGIYSVFNMDKGEARRLWDILLLPGLLVYTLFAGLLATALIARLRMWRFKLGWEHAIGTGMLAYLSALSCAALSLVPLGLLLICRHCGVRLALFILLNLAAWIYMGYFCLGDLGERPRGFPLLAKSLAYGLPLYLLTYIPFLALIMCVIPM